MQSPSCRDVPHSTTVTAATRHCRGLNCVLHHLPDITSHRQAAIGQNRTRPWCQDDPRPAQSSPTTLQQQQRRMKVCAYYVSTGIPTSRGTERAGPRGQGLCGQARLQLVDALLVLLLLQLQLERKALLCGRLAPASRPTLCHEHQLGLASLDQCKRQCSRAG